ncbi:MAG: helix-turn-helix domain-containing protein [Burkholderiaceae bacterium]
MKTIRLAVLAYQGCMPTQLFGIADVLRIAEDIGRGMGLPHQRQVAVDLIGLDGRPIAVAGGQSMQVKRPSGHFDLLIVPGLGIRRPTDWSARLAPLSREVAFIRRRFARGTAVASVCVGAFLLGEAGLLDGRRATTAWLFADELAARYPLAHVNANAILLDDGAVTTSGAVSAVFDMAIALVKRYWGAEVATATARVALLTSERPSQSPYVDAALMERESRLPTFSQNLTQWFDARLAERYELAKVAQAFHVSGRTLMRRVKAETGLSPLALLQHARMEKAKQLLRTTHWPIARIIDAVGYSDPTSFARLFSRQVGESPARYRRR